MTKNYNLPVNATIFFIIIINFSKTSFAADDYRYEACGPINCGAGPNISFPFYIPSLQQPYCGYPGFELSCSTHGHPVLQLPPNPNEYVVENISYQNRLFHVYNAVVLESEGRNCFPNIQNTTIPLPRFNFVNTTGWVRLFSGCPDPLPEGLRRYNVSDCNNWGLAIYDEDDLGNATEICDTNVLAPVGDEGRIGNSNVSEVLRRGFEMNWTASGCNECADSGGRCGFNTSTYHFRCFCPDRPHSRSCKPADSSCPPSFECGDLGTLEFPLSDQSGCGLFLIENCSGYPVIQFGAERHWYGILEKVSTNQLFIFDPLLLQYLTAQSCLGVRNLSLPVSASSTLTVTPNLTVFMCLARSSNSETIQDYFENYNRRNCSPFDVYYRNPETSVPLTDIPPGCSTIQVPINSSRDSSDLLDLLSPQYVIEWNVSEDCYNCHHRGGKCLTNSMNVFHCGTKRDKKRVVLIASLASVGGVLVIAGLLFSFIFLYRKKRRDADYLLSRNLSYDPSSKPEVDGTNTYYGIPIFSYTELEEATNNFDPSKELGDGGFGTVYYGKLHDGREVAIKRLYEHNYRRVEQFMNEIKILTCLRHKNLVSLYGCTSRRSRELLLVYEYISNGTVSEHLHGELSKESPLSWPVRMSVAIQTANALAYLHKSDIIHRDVKTCNILLDANFCVKVADFGLSRLFPTNVTHISTAPQGTPGYVDPEYHQCYQLTDKSDVYSFGVVLIELISSMPAVDITRHRPEINLANLAVNRIQRCAFDELIDSSLGYNCDAEVTRMTTSVAELAFRCLQLDKDMRPSMDEVVDFLGDIQGGEDCKNEKVKGPNGNCGKIPPSPETDDAVLLKKKNLMTSSPNAVTDSWASSSSTTTSSIS